MDTKYPETQTLEISIADFQKGLDTETAENITSFDKSVNCYNFDLKSGALKESVGFETLTIPATFEDNSSERNPLFYEGSTFAKLGVYKIFSKSQNKRIDKIIAITGENKVEFCKLVTPYPAMMNLDEQTFQEVPKLFNYNDGENDIILFATESEGLFSWDNTTGVKQYTDGPIVTNLCMHKDRTFITEGGERLNIVCDTTNLLKWAEDTMPEFRVTIALDSEHGSVNKLLTMDGYIFAIREYGITRIFWYDSGTYNLTDLMFSGGRIYGNTACVCGKFGLVLCKDGLYKFDSVSAEKLDLKLNTMLKGISNSNAVSAFRNGIYYLACKLDFGDDKKIGCESEDYKNNALIMYDVSTGSFTISRGLDIIDLCSIQYESVDKLLACFNGEYSSKIGQLVEGGKTFGEIQAKYWQSPLSDLGYSDKNKYVKEISLMSKHDIVLSVFTETERRDFNVKGGLILNKFPVRIKGKQVGISIFSESEKAFVSNLKLTVELLEGNYV
jgi:hypothetical protein